MAYNDKNTRNYSFDTINGTYGNNNQTGYNDGTLTAEEEADLRKNYPSFSNPAEIKWDHSSFNKKLAYAVNEAIKG